MRYRLMNFHNFIDKPNNKYIFLVFQLMFPCRPFFFKMPLKPGTFLKNERYQINNLANWGKPYARIHFGCRLYAVWTSFNFERMHIAIACLYFLFYLLFQLTFTWPRTRKQMSANKGKAVWTCTYKQMQMQMKICWNSDISVCSPSFFRPVHGFING